MDFTRSCGVAGALLLAATLASPASAGEPRGGGKLLLTNGISTIEGSAGGGLTPWAVIAGNATKDGVGVQSGITVAALRSYDFRSLDLAIGAWDRIELSYAHQRFDTNKVGGKLGLGNNYKFDQDIWGAKLRLAGDAVYGPALLPAVAVGAQYKKSLSGAIVHAIGARHSGGTDVYASATKLFLARSILVDTTARLTKANQTGLLGFGGDRGGGYTLQAESSVAWQLSRRFAIGAEYRTKPDRLSIAHESDWADLFAVLAIGRHLTATVAYADLGAIATEKGQRGLLLQLQGSF
ncbi:MAG: hypothetical protein JWP15_990 [Alphaproteobacteria bacterium]|nr:hypothetical protein [Alphaproteobacteria bacterium]